MVAIFKTLNKTEFIPYKAEIFHTFNKRASFAPTDVKSGSLKTIYSGMDFSILLWFFFNIEGFNFLHMNI
jgi:hypothetical protein